MSTKVQIYDQTYYVAGDLESSYLEQLAHLVDARMREIARATGTVDSVKVAVLAALSIADELYAERQRDLQHGSEELRERVRHCLGLIERALSA